MAYMLGDRSEDHLSGILFNIGAIMDHEKNISLGLLPEDLDDRPLLRRIVK